MTRALLAVALALAGCGLEVPQIEPPLGAQFEVCCLLYPNETAMLSCLMDAAYRDVGKSDCWEFACPRVGWEIDLVCWDDEGQIVPLE